MVRRRRTSAPEVVAVTGAAGGLGRALLERLAVRDDLAGLVGIDERAAPVDGVLWRRADPGGPLPARCLARVTTVVHLATSYDVHAEPAGRRALNVHGTAGLLRAAAEAGVARVVLATSAEVWGALPDNPVPLPDAAPLRAGADDSALLGDHLEVELLVPPAEVAGLEVTVLRPATLVGAALGPAYDGQRLGQLAAPRLLAVRGTEPLWQLCHVEDLLSALELAATGQVSGRLAVASPGALPQRTVEQQSGRRRLELPGSVAVSTAQRLQQLGLSASSTRELDHLLGPLVVAADGLAAAGWTAGWTNEAALAAHLASAGVGRAGAYTAAGATVAVLGSAVLLRRARRRRRLG